MEVEAVVQMLDAVEEAVVDDLEVDAVEAGSLAGGPLGAIIAVAAVEAVKEVGEVLAESVAESAGEAVSEALQDAVGAAVKSAAGTSTDEAMINASGITAGEAVVDWVLEKINDRMKGGLSNKVKKRVRWH